MVAGFYAHCGDRDRDQTRDAGCLPKFSLEIKPHRLFAHDTDHPLDTIVGSGYSPVLRFSALMSLRPHLRPLLRHGRFGRLWFAYTVSTLGSQFHLVALTWSVVRLVGSASALGAVLMVGALPRALLILAGGVVSDRFPPAFVLVSSQLVRALLSGALALLIANGVLIMPHLFAVAVLFGIAEAFSFPASSSLIPTIVGREFVQPANGILQGSAYVAGLLGPACAGWLLAARGAASCFAIDAASFVILFSRCSKGTAGRKRRPFLFLS
jgi:MFS family permease